VQCRHRRDIQLPALSTV